MSDARRTKLRDAVDVPEIEIDMRSTADAGADAPLTPEQAFRRRQAEVTQQDHDEFTGYLEAKRERDQQEAARAAAEAATTPPTKLNRRSMLKWAAGTAVAGEAAALGYTMMAGGDIPSHGTMHSGASSAEAQRHYIERELINPQANINGRTF